MFVNGNPLERSARFDMVCNRFPVKHGWDALALGQIFLRREFSLDQKLKCLKFYFDGGGISNLFATLTRSGSNWSLLGIALAIDLSRGGDGSYYLDKHFWYPRDGICYTKLDWRTPAGTLGIPCNEPVVLHTHHPYYRLRCAQIKNMKIVVVLRPIVQSMESKYFKLARVPDHPTEQDDREFGWEKMLSDAIEFYNGWGDAMRRNGNIHVFKYEDLLADPVGSHKEITDIWNLAIPVDCLQQAFDSVTKKEMRKRLPEEKKNSNMRVSFRSRSATIPEHRLDMIRRHLARRLRYDFGYRLP